jgi:hypothetical protein
LKNRGDGATFHPEATMEARIIIPTAAGERLTYELRLHQSGGREEFRIVFSTSEEKFERWLFYLLRDVGAHIVTDDPARLRQALGLAKGESGVVAQSSVADVGVTGQMIKS